MSSSKEQNRKHTKAPCRERYGTGLAISIYWSGAHMVSSGLIPPSKTNEQVLLKGLLLWDLINCMPEQGPSWTKIMPFLFTCKRLAMPHLWIISWKISPTLSNSRKHWEFMATNFGRQRLKTQGGRRAIWPDRRVDVLCLTQRSKN